MDFRFSNQGITEFLPTIYDAVTNPDNWTRVLDRFHDLCDADGASLMLGDVQNADVQLLPVSSAFSAPFDAEHYRETYSPEDARALEVLSASSPFQWIAEEEAFGAPANELAGTKYLMEAIGMERRYGARLSTSRIWIDGVSLNYKTGQNRFGDETMRVSKVILPHFAKALEISRPFILLKSRFNAILAVLDKFHVGVMIVTGDGETVLTNLAAQMILDADNGLSLSHDRRIRVDNADVQAQLFAQIRLASGQDDHAVASPPLAIDKKSRQTSWLVETAPLSEFDGNIGGRFLGAVMFITDPDRYDIISTASIEALYGLTPAESDVAARVADGHSSEDIADMRGTSLTTAKSQIRSLFAKTGVHNRTELARLALKVNLPVDRA